MPFSRCFVLPLLLCVCAAAGVAAETEAKAPAVPPAKAKAVRELLQLTGAGSMGVMVMDQMIASFRQNMPGVPDDFWKDFRAEVRPEELEALIVPVYARHLSMDDLKALIDFYKTPVGQKFIRVQPLIMRESYAVGQAWGKELAGKAVRKIQARRAKPAADGKAAP